MPTEPLPFSPSKVGNQQPSSSLTTSNAITQSQRDSLYPNPPSPEGMDVRSYNSHRPSVSAEEVVNHTIKQECVKYMKPNKVLINSC